MGAEGASAAISARLKQPCEELAGKNKPSWIEHYLNSIKGDALHVNFQQGNKDS